MRSNLGILGLLSLALIFAVVQYSEANSLITVHKTITPPSINWTAACINFPCKTTKDLFKSSKKFIQTHNIGTRLQIYDGCIYVAYPRYKTGVPMTLGVSCKFEGCGATFDPYPCWSYHEEGNCDALQSVSDFKIDQNGLLWVLDTGIIYSMDNPTRTCGPKIVVFNARTKKVVRVIKLDQLTVPQSRLQYLLVDYSESGRCFVYISDAATRSVIVYDVQARRGYRLVLPGSVLKGFGKKDVLYLALTTCSEKNRLYFTYLSSRKVYYIDVENLRQGNSRGKIIEAGIKPDEMVWVGYDGCWIYFRYTARPEVYRWSTDTSLKTSNFKLVFKSSYGLLTTHVAADYDRQKMRALQSNFHDFITGEVGCGVHHQVADIQGCYIQP